MATTIAAPATRVNTRVVGLFAIASTLGIVALLLPNRFVEPMGKMTHYMALVGPENSAHPWTLLDMFAPVIVVYGMILPYLAGWVSESTLKLGVLLLGLITVPISIYMVRWGLLDLTSKADWHGVVDVLAITAYSLLAVPAFAAAHKLARVGEVDKGRVVLSGIILHFGMITGMLSVALFSAGGGHG